MQIPQLFTPGASSMQPHDKPQGQSLFDEHPHEYRTVAVESTVSQFEGSKHAEQSGKNPLLSAAAHTGFCDAPPEPASAAETALPPEPLAPAVPPAPVPLEPAAPPVARPPAAAIPPVPTLAPPELAAEPPVALDPPVPDELLPPVPLLASEPASEGETPDSVLELQDSAAMLDVNMRTLPRANKEFMLEYDGRGGREF